MPAHPRRFRSFSAAVLLGTGLLVAACTDESATPPSVPTSPPSAPASVPPGSDEAGDAWQSPWPVAPAEAAAEDGPLAWTVAVVDRLDHDTGAFTQGLEFGATGLFEGTGREGESTVRVLDPDTGEVRRIVDLDEHLFGEGLTVAGDELVQLTWRNGVALRRDATTLDLVGEFRYEGEGWGLCATDDEFWMSDGSDVLVRRDLTTFASLDQVTVRRGTDVVSDLNELECIGDHVVANVWKSDDIVVIDPDTGNVVATIDAGALALEIGAGDDAAVLNGIADRGDGTLLLSGKLWPTTFVVEVVSTPEPRHTTDVG